MRASRDRLPYSSQLITYLLSEQSGATRESFHLGQWLASLDDDSLEFLCSAGMRVAKPISDPEDLETRSDLVLLLEMTLFEERCDDMTIEVGVDGSVPLLTNIGYCAGLEILRRNGWAVLNFISINLEFVQVMLTSMGISAQSDVIDLHLLHVFKWAESRALAVGVRGH